MNKIWITITTLVLLSSFFAGCAKKDNGVDGGNLDESAVYDDALADTGYQVSGSLTSSGVALATGTNGSAATAKTVDTAMDDAAGAVDKADFVLDARTADGERVQAVLRSMAAGADVRLDQDLLGGAANNVQVFGTTGLGPSAFPETKAYLVLFGLSRINMNGTTLERSQFTQVFVTKGIRDASGALSASVDEKDLEMHVLIGATPMGAGNPMDNATDNNTDNSTANGTDDAPTGATGGPSPIPGVEDGFLYYYFENVRLKQLSPEAKAEIGSKLTTPERPNIPPVVVARVILPDGSSGTSGMIVSTSAAPGNLTVSLDASLSQDEDGTIEAYSWDIKETNATGALVPAGNQSKPSGSNVSFTFHTGGLKAIGLRIIDNDGGIANTTLYFFVDYNLKASYDFRTQPTGAVGGGDRCIVPNNCNEHNFQVGYGAQKLTIKMPTQTSGTCNTAHVDLYNPSGTAVSGSNTAQRNVDAAGLAGKVGKWKASVWYTAQANCVYAMDVLVTYTPAPAAA